MSPHLSRASLRALIPSPGAQIRILTHFAPLVMEKHNLRKTVLASSVFWRLAALARGAAGGTRRPGTSRRNNRRSGPAPRRTTAPADPPTVLDFDRGSVRLVLQRHYRCFAAIEPKTARRLPTSAPRQRTFRRCQRPHNRPGLRVTRQPAVEALRAHSLSYGSPLELFFAVMFVLHLALATVAALAAASAG